MSQMIFFLKDAHYSLGRLFKRMPSSLPLIKRRIHNSTSRHWRLMHQFQNYQFMTSHGKHSKCLHNWYTRNGLTLRSVIGSYVAAAKIKNFGLVEIADIKRFYATGTTRKSDSDENQPMNVVLKEIRIQEKIYKHKVDRSEAVEMRQFNRVVADDVSLGPEQKLEILRSTTATTAIPSNFDQFNSGFEQTSRTGNLIVDHNRLTQIFTHSDPPLSGVRNRIDRKLAVPLIPNKIQTKESFKDANRIAQKPPRVHQIIYPKLSEKPQLSFKVPQIGQDPYMAKKKGPATSYILPSPPKPELNSTAPPKFAESTTQRIKMLLDNCTKPSETIANDLNDLNYKVDVKNRILKILGQHKKGTPSSDSKDSKTEEVIDGPVDMLGNPILPPENKLITSMMQKEMHVMPVDGEGKEDPKGNDGDPRTKHSKKSKGWTGIKYTFGFLGLATTCFGGYIMILIGSPKFDEKGDILLDKYSHLPLVMQYFYRIRDELENYNKMIKEPSREKLLPEILQPPYYQPPYTLILEFTDLLVHPEWTYKTGWRFKKRPGVDQFLESLYTRFEVVVYTAQMGMTVFPILEALDSKNLISYKLVRDATNFVDGDHVKDLDKLNRDLSKVVVVDWNAQSCKLHKSNMFKIPRWDGSDEDRTLYDLAAFLIAISEWEIQDVRAVLEYYGQFDNPLLKFKENQMQVLQSAHT